MQAEFLYTFMQHLSTAPQGSFLSEVFAQGYAAIIAAVKDHLRDVHGAR